MAWYLRRVITRAVRPLQRPPVDLGGVPGQRFEFGKVFAAVDADVVAVALCPGVEASLIFNSFLKKTSPTSMWRSYCCWRWNVRPHLRQQNLAASACCWRRCSSNWPASEQARPHWTQPSRPASRAWRTRCATSDGFLAKRRSHCGHAYTVSASFTWVSKVRVHRRPSLILCGCCVVLLPAGSDRLAFFPFHIRARALVLNIRNPLLLLLREAPKLWHAD